MGSRCEETVATALILILRHLLPLRSHPLHDRPGSIHHHAQLTTNRDELPAFRDPVFRLLDAHAVIAGRDAMFLTGGEDVGVGFGRGLGTWWFAVFATHGGGEIVGADEDGVDAGDGENGVGILDRLDMLALEDEQQFAHWRGRNNQGRSSGN